MEIFRFTPSFFKYLSKGEIWSDDFSLIVN